MGTLQEEPQQSQLPGGALTVCYSVLVANLNKQVCKEKSWWPACSMQRICGGSFILNSYIQSKKERNGCKVLFSSSSKQTEKVWGLACNLGISWFCFSLGAQDLRLYQVLINFGSTSRRHEEANFDRTSGPWLKTFQP